MSRSETQNELTPAKKIAGNIIAGSMVVLCGIFLLLSGIGVFPLKISDVALPSCLIAVGLTLLITAVINRNPVSLWLSFMFLTPAAVSLCTAYTSLTYANLYPFYIASPAIASLLTLPMTPRSFKSHIKVILFFGVLAFLFMLNSLIGIGGNIVLPIILVAAGAAIIAVAALALRPVKTDKDK